MIEDHGYPDPRAGAVRWNQNLLSNQCGGKIVDLESYMRNGLDRLGIGRIPVKSHPLNATWTGSKTSDVNVQVGYVNFIRTRSLSGNSKVVIAPAILRGCCRRFVVLSHILTQDLDLLSAGKAVRLYL